MMSQAAQVKRAESEKARRSPSHEPSGSPVFQMIALQHAAGNFAVQRMLKSGAIRASLRIGQPNDIYEQEADHVADQIMRMPEHAVQRQCSPGSKCPAEEEDEENTIQAKSERSFSGIASVPDSFVSSLGSGQPLDPAAKVFFEPRFGADFRDVRVHTGYGADYLNDAIDARAFTLGRDIVFREGEFNPATPGGQRLIAHELAHVVQQSHGRVRRHENNMTVHRDAIRMLSPLHSSVHGIIQRGKKKYTCSMTNDGKIGSVYFKDHRIRLTHKHGPTKTKPKKDTQQFHIKESTGIQDYQKSNEFTNLTTKEQQDLKNDQKKMSHMFHKWLRKNPQEVYTLTGIDEILDTSKLSTGTPSKDIRLVEVFRELQSGTGSTTSPTYTIKGKPHISRGSLIQIEFDDTLDTVLENALNEASKGKDNKEKNTNFYNYIDKNFPDIITNVRKPDEIKY
jgi:hypothetical protein